MDPSTQTDAELAAQALEHYEDSAEVLRRRDTELHRLYVVYEDLASDVYDGIEPGSPAARVNQLHQPGPMQDAYKAYEARLREIAAGAEIELRAQGQFSSDNAHLTVTTSDRGFDRLPPIPSEYGGQVRVYESSAAMAPHIWLAAEAPVDLNNRTGPTHEVPIHLTVDNARRLAEQLLLLVDHHYQTEDD